MQMLSESNQMDGKVAKKDRSEVRCRLVRSGFDSRTVKRLRTELKPLERVDAALAVPPNLATHISKQTLQIAFLFMWTAILATALMSPAFSRKSSTRATFLVVPL